MVDAQEGVARARGADDRFVDIGWLRDDGRHGGGMRCELADTAVFDRASVNVSQVHYDDEPAASAGVGDRAVYHTWSFGPDGRTLAPT